jgi:hypothetical protein
MVRLLSKSKPSLGLVEAIMPKPCIISRQQACVLSSCSTLVEVPLTIAESFDKPKGKKSVREASVKHLHCAQAQVSVAKIVVIKTINPK